MKEFLEHNDLQPTSVRIISRDGQSKGFGYADFDSAEEAAKCINLSGSELDGRRIRCDNADNKSTPSSGGRGRGGRGSFGSGGRGRGGRGSFGSGGGGNRFDNETPTKLLMVKNLSYNTDNYSLAAAFEGANDARVVKDRETGNSRGFAFVEYDDVDSATKARKAMLNQELDGRAINVVFATPKESFGGGRGGGRGGSGGRGRGGGFGRGRGGRGGGPTAASKGSIQKFEGSKLTFGDDSD